MQNRPDFIKCLKKGGSEKAISELKTFMRIELTNIENDEDLEEEEYLLYIEKVELANFALKLARKLLRKKDIVDFLGIAIDCICSFKQDDISSAFSGIFETLIESNSQTIPIVLNIASYCFPQSGIASTSQEINTILSFKTRQKLENDEDFYYASHICDNILEGVAVSGTSRNIDGFWPLTQYLLKHKSINKQWIAQSCLSASLAIIDRFPERQYHFFDELLTLIVEELELEIKLEKARDMKKLENIMENFMRENKVALIYKNDTRNTIFKFLQYFLEMALKVDMFVNWIVKISSFSDVEISRRRCLAVMELCVKKSSLQHAYLDILVSVMKICKITIAGNSIFRQFESSEARSSENFLQELSKVVHPDAQSFAKKLLPSPDVLWAKLRSNEVSKVSVVRSAIIIGSCHFLNSEDDKKQIIPILLLTCLNELREKFGQKWDKFRLHISGSSNKTLSDLSEFTDPILMTDENLKIDALKCALLIDKKPRQLMQLVADMTISIISKGNLLEIEKILPFLRVFFEENPASSTDIVKEINIFLSKNVAQKSSAIFRVIQEYPGDIEMELDVMEKLVENYSNSPDFLKVLLKLSQIPPKVFEKIEISFEEKIYIEIWEKFANGIVDIQVLNKVFEKEKGQKFAGFVENINMSNLAEEVKVTIYSTLGAHFVIKDDLTNLHSLIGILNKNHIFEKYHAIFAKTLVSRILFDSKLTDEKEIREILRNYIMVMVFLTGFVNVKSFMQLFRPILIFWCLVEKSANRNVIYSILDFVCEEFLEEEVTNSQSEKDLKKERKNMITNNFAQLLQFWRFHDFENQQIWKMCEEYCDFREEDVRNCISIFRKDVVYRLIIVGIDDFSQKQSSKIMEIIKKTYESLHRGGRQFSIGAIVEYRSEGLDLLAIYRSYMTQNRYFHQLKSQASRSFAKLLPQLSQQFFDENWWSILLILRHISSNHESAWKLFIERLDYSNLRLFLWRIVADISRIPSRCIKEKINLTIWNRLNFAGKLENDSICLKYFWIIPKSCERDFVKLRKFEDLLQLMSEFEKYPITLYFENICFYIERGNIWKYDLPRLVNSLISMIVKCENEEQQKEVGQILKTIPILSSCQTDTDFIRWDMTAEFYQNPGQRTQCLLDECVLFIEKISVDADFLEFSDRTLCEIARYIDVNNCEDPMRKITGESVKIFYSRMNCTAKPDPQNLVQPQSPTFELWLTRKIIASCIVEEDDPQFVSFLPISNVKNVGFLTKLAGKFLIHAICKKRENVLQNILTEFEQCLHNAISQRTTRLERRTATFVFYIFDFLYFYSNQKYLQKSQKSEVDEFCKRIIMNTIKDEHGHDIPLIVKVAEKFGMEKRAILWMEMFMELKMENAKGEEIKHVETSAYFVLMNLYARIGDLNGVTGSYNRLSKNQVDHIFAKILLNEAHGKLSEANVLYRFVEQKRASEPLEIVQNALENVKYDEEEEEECKDYENCLKSLTKWDSFENIETPQVFDRNLEMNARIARIFTTENSLDLLEKEKSRTILRMTEEAAIGGNCSYETAIPYIVEMKCFEEIEQIRNASMDELMDVETKFWNGLTKQTEESEQHSEYLEPILRCRRLAIIEKMHKMSEKEREKLKTIIVDTHLHSARLARLSGCFETAQISILHAKKVQPFNKRIVLEEAKLQLQTSDDEAGMILLNSLLATTFGELSKHFGDSQQCSNIDLKNTAKMQIESFQTEEKNLYSSVQMLRISHLIRLGNTITFEKIYEETNNLLSSFVSSGVMYEAAWLLDYLNQFSEKSKTCLPLLKAYKEVAKYEKNRVLQARAVERMTSLWLEYSKKLSQVIAKKTTANDLPKRMSDMNHEMKNAMSQVGWRAFYPAYAILARKIDHEDQDVFLTMKRMMIQLIIRLPHQCMWQSVHILRSEDAKKIEKYREVLNDVKLKHRGYSRIFEQYDFASATFKNVPEKMRSSDSELSKVVPDIKMMIHSKKYNPKQLEIDRRGEGEQEMSCGIMIPIRSDIDSSVIEQSEENPEDLDNRYLIHDYSEKVKILSSLTKPVIIEIMTMAGRKIRLILKKDDDLTKDYHFTKMVEMCNDLLAKDEVTRISNLSATTYSVIPLAKTGGIIEFMDGCSTYFEALEEYMNLKSEQMNQHIREMRNKTGKEEKLRYFREDWCKDTPLVMAKWFRNQYPEAGKWYSSRKLFAKSCAVMSIIGFIFGLGDRHTRNVMIHLPTGKCVHVDFDMVFNLGEFLDVPEVVPFRLTRNMVNGMGEVALEGEFRVVCEQTLRVFRENAYEIEKYISDLPDLVSSPKLSAAIAKIQNETGNRDFKYDMKLAKQFISGRLRGQIMTARIYKSHAVSHPLSAVQMSASLIELAKNEEKLVEMFHGWMPNV